MESTSMYPDGFFAEVTAAYGGLNKMALALGYSITRVSNWRTGIPAKECKGISDATGISLQRLRPVDWHKYWPELAEAA